MTTAPHFNELEASCGRFSGALLLLVLLGISRQRAGSSRQHFWNGSGCGRRAAGECVEVTNVDTGVSQHLITNSSGYFEAPLLQPANYQVTVALKGYKKTMRAIVLGVGQQVSLPSSWKSAASTRRLSSPGRRRCSIPPRCRRHRRSTPKMVEALPMISNMPIMLTRFAAGVNPTRHRHSCRRGSPTGRRPPPARWLAVSAATRIRSMAPRIAAPAVASRRRRMPT